MQTYIEKVRNQAPLLKLGKARKEALDRPFKAKNSKQYFENSYIECFYFCQQCKDYFETAGAKAHKRIFFAASFLWNKISFRWQQHKTQLERARAVLPIWDKFKVFL